MGLLLMKKLILSAYLCFIRSYILEANKNNTHFAFIMLILETGPYLQFHVQIKVNFSFYAVNSSTLKLVLLM